MILRPAGSGFFFLRPARAGGRGRHRALADWGSCGQGNGGAARCGRAWRRARGNLASVEASSGRRGADACEGEPGAAGRLRPELAVLGRVRARRRGRTLAGAGQTVSGRSLAGQRARSWIPRGRRLVRPGRLAGHGAGGRQGRRWWGQGARPTTGGSVKKRRTSRWERREDDEKIRTICVSGGSYYGYIHRPSMELV